MSIEQVATNFGLPGLLILVIYLLQKARDERQAKIEERKLDLDEKRVEGMFRQAEAMTTGFISLVQAMANNHAQDIQSHAELGNAIAEIKGSLDEARRPTPVEGMPIQRQFDDPPSHRTPPRGLPVAGGYGPMRPKTSGGG